MQLLATEASYAKKRFVLSRGGTIAAQSNSSQVVLCTGSTCRRNFFEKSWPRAASAALIHKYIEEEEEDMDRIQGVIDFITASSCLSRELARHFGDESTVLKNGCRSCQYCLIGMAIQFSLGGDRKGRIDDAKVKAILATTMMRDDPGFLARVGFGILSPRVAIEKLGWHPVFGPLSDCEV